MTLPVSLRGTPSAEAISAGIATPSPFVTLWASARNDNSVCRCERGEAILAGIAAPELALSAFRFFAEFMLRNEVLRMTGSKGARNDLSLILH